MTTLTGEKIKEIRRLVSKHKRAKISWVAKVSHIPEETLRAEIKTLGLIIEKDELLIRSWKDERFDQIKKRFLNLILDYSTFTFKPYKEEDEPLQTIFLLLSNKITVVSEPDATALKESLLKELKNKNLNELKHLLPLRKYAEMILLHKPQINLTKQAMQSLLGLATNTEKSFSHESKILIQKNYQILEVSNNPYKFLKFKYDGSKELVFPAHVLKEIISLLTEKFNRAMRLAHFNDKSMSLDAQFETITTLNNYLQANNIKPNPEIERLISSTNLFVVPDMDAKHVLHQWREDFEKLLRGEAVLKGFQMYAGPINISDPKQLVNFAADMMKQNLQDAPVVVLLGTLSNDPSFYDAWYLLARYFVGNNLFFDASRCYKKAIEIKPEQFNLYIDLATIYLNLFKYNDAIEILETVIRKRPEFIEALELLVMTYIHVGDTTKAIEWNRKLRSLQGKHK
ncbi:MAG: tetratricopeptide repeat protein [Candidatus Heimdallarchaeota archaeon]